MTFRLTIGGDIAPTPSNFELFANGDAQILIGDELLNLFRSSDGIFLNLETPLVDIPSPIEKNGPNLIAPSSSIVGLAAIDSYCYGLANNHIMDQGIEGLISTVGLLDQAGISHVGAGNNLSEAFKPFFFNFENNAKVGIYACAEHEFTIAGKDYPGANPYDPLESFDHVASLKQACDYAIVIYHGGKEFYRYPSPLLQKACRRFIEKGADLVVCQHSHCVGCEEAYQHGKIVYGQGNFLFDLGDDEFWNTAIVTSVQFDDSGNSQIEHYPIVKKGNRARMASEDEAQSIIEGFNMRSEQIKDPAFVEEEYVRYATNNMRDYHMRLLGFTFFSRLMNKLSFNYYFRKRYSRMAELAIVNMLDCEAHRELAAAGLMNSGKSRS